MDENKIQLTLVFDCETEEQAIRFLDEAKKEFVNGFRPGLISAIGVSKNQTFVEGTYRDPNSFPPPNSS